MGVVVGSCRVVVGVSISISGFSSMSIRIVILISISRCSSCTSCISFSSK